MEILFMLLGFAVFIFMFALVGHAIWVVLASIVRFFTVTPNPQPNIPPINSPENDLAQSYLAIDRLHRGKLLSEDAFQQACFILEKAALDRKIELPWIPSKRLSDPQFTPIVSPRFESPSHEAPSPIPVVTSPDPLEVHPLEKEYAPAPPPLINSLATQTRRTLGNVLQQFLSEKNIHWGELVSALLIVGSAVGLILSLRTELNRLIPMFPSVLFFLVTLAIHLAGFYTLKRWKLPSTSRGLLVLGALMMCVTSLATVLLTEQSNAPVSSLVPLALGTVGFGWLAYLSSASLFPAMRTLWTVAVTLGGLAPLMLGYWLDQRVELERLKWACNLAIASPSVSVIGLVVLQLSFRSLAASISLRSQLRLLGITFIGSLFAIGLIVFMLRGIPGGVLSLSLMLSALGGLLVCAGSIITFKSHDDDARTKAELSESLIDRVAIIGVAVSFLGAGVMGLSLGSSWGNSQLFLETACANAVVSIILAILWRQSTLTAVATAFSTIACWLLVHYFSGSFPTPNMRVGWVIQALGTVRSSVVFFSCAAVFGSLARTSPHKHRTILLISSACVGLLGFIIAGYLGCTATRLGPHTFAILCFVVLGGFTAVMAPFLARREAAVIGSFVLLFAWFILARPTTELSSRWNIHTGFLEDFFTFALSGHAITLTLLGGLISMIRPDSVGAKFLPALSKRLPEPRIEKWISDSGMLTASVCIPLLIRVVPTLHWLWQASLLSMLAFGCWVGWQVARGNWRESLAWLASGASICFFMAWGVNQINSSGVLVSSSVSIAIAMVFVLGTTCSILLSRPKRILTSRTKLKAWSTPYGDGLLIVLSSLFVLHLILESQDWWQSVKNARINASVWTISIVMLFVSAIVLTATRIRSLYIWLTGALSTIVVFAMFGIWSTTGGDEVAFFYLLLGAPQLVSGIASFVDLCRRRQPGKGLHAIGSYETVVGTGTIFFWALTTCIGVISNLEDPTTRAYGLWSPVGLLWIAVGLTSFWLASHVINRRRFVTLLLIGSLSVSWNLPIAIARTFSAKLEPMVGVSLLFVGVAIQVLIVSWFVLQGISVSSIIRRWLKPDNCLAEGETRQVCWNYVNFSSACLGCICLFGGISTANAESVRLFALTAAVLAFGNGLLVRRGNDEDSAEYLPLIPAVINRYLLLIFLALFMLFAVWANLGNMSLVERNSHRILHAAAIMIATTIGIGVAFAWLSRLQSKNDPQLGQASKVENVEDRSDNAHAKKWLTWGLGNRIPLPRWTETLGCSWIGSAVLAVSFLAIGFVVVLTSTNERLDWMAELISRKSFATEAIWIALLSGVWASQLVAQAIRPNWNVALLSAWSLSLYVYVAELVVLIAGALFASIFPEWFRLPMREYWPVLMLLTAVVVQGVAAVLRRAGVSAVGDPLHNTSLILPIVAPLAMLFIASESSLEMVLALGAVFYFFLGATERSRQMAMLGGAFANGALLCFWNRFESLDFTQHPQLWLIPPAASIALATHFERDRIPKEAASWLRYLSMATIFCSSSSEILIQGIGRSLWPPMVLMVLSLLVGFLGIAFQVKSYLYSSLMFTLFSVVAMVAHAQQSVQHTWPWWVLGISLGVGVLVLFAMFERKRDQLTKLSETLKSWE